MRSSRRRAKLGHQRSGLRRVAIYKLVISTTRLQALSGFDRYVFALLGHIFNDLMLTQKLVHISRVHPTQSNTYERETGVGVSLYFLRTLAARTKEVMETLRQEKISSHIEKQIFAPAGLDARWREALKLFYRMDKEWLARVRNVHAFHYLREDQFQPYLSDELCDHAHALVGKKYGDTFFTWSHIRAGHAMLEEVDPNDPFAGLGRMLDELGQLLTQLVDCLAQGLQNYIATNLTDAEPLHGPVYVPAPDFHTFNLPYFFRA